MSNSRFSYEHVLIVDDSEIDVLVNRRLIELTFFAARITTTTSGEEALRFLREECSSEKSAPDWIFLDMHLPGMSGFDLIEEFKNLPDYITCKSKIIVLSVFQKQEKLQKVLGNKFVAGQLEKPLTQKALKEIAENTSASVNAFS
jgi:CheY-like chemotaxis protein